MDLRLLNMCTKVVGKEFTYFLYENQGSLILRKKEITALEVSADPRLEKLDSLILESSDFITFDSWFWSFSVKRKDTLYFKVKGTQIELFLESSYRNYVLSETFKTDTSLEDFNFSINPVYLAKVYRFFGRDISMPTKVFISNNKQYIYFFEKEYTVIIFLIESRYFREFITDK